jgi:hypothetical protein
MRIESVHASGSRPTSPPDHSLMSQPAPAHVDTLRWKLADASERRQLMATHAGRPQPHAEPAPQASSAPSSLLHAPLAAGVFQDLRYPVPNNFRAADGSPSKFDLTFRDRSGFPNPTSHAYLNRTSPAPGNSWKGLRLDHGPNPTIGGASNWHWNHKGAGGFGIPDHTAATRFESGVGRTLQAAKPLGRAAVVVGAALDGFSLAKEVQASRKTGDWSNTAQEGARIAGGWTGAVVGAKAAGSAGAAIGTLIAPGIGTVVGGAVGGLIGGAVGYIAGSSVGSTIAGWFK